MLVATSIALLLLLLLSGLPIAFALGLSGLFILYMTLGPAIINAVPQMMFVSIDKFTLIAIPFFILTAELLIAGGATRRLITAVETLIGHWRGGLATVAVGACAFFSAISGSSAATAVAIGAILVPEMIRRGYEPKYAAGLVAVSGGLGILIPPSIPMIVYGAIAEQSVGRLFMAGIIPGLVLTAALMASGMVLLGRNRPPEPRASWAQRVTALRDAFWILMLPVMIAVLIYGGIATPTEAAGAAVVYSLFCALFVYKGLNAKGLARVLAESAGKSAMVLLILAGATVFAFALTIVHVPQTLTAAALAQDVSPVVMLLIINAILIVLGMFLDIMSIMMITAPIFLPIIKAIGIDPIHFGMIFVLNMELALITPPLGIHLFILSSITRLPVTTIFKGVLPFAVVLLAVLLLITYVPWLSLVLVR
jgi:C4-dicarboxylate transporter, DctM subunit